MIWILKYSSNGTVITILFYSLTVPPTSIPTGVIAFHAYLSRDSSGPLPMHHILKFDMVPMNIHVGNGYKAFDGIFIAPTSGTYVFSLSFMSDVHGYVPKCNHRTDKICNRHWK